MTALAGTASSPNKNKKWRCVFVSIEMALVIDAVAVDHGQTTATVAARLVSLGGTMLSYKHAVGAPHAKAVFGFETERDRDRFALRALKMPGVSLIESG
jgi:hypothetical protein